MSEESHPGRKSPTLGFVASLVVPGGGFLYLGRPLTGLFLGGAVVASFVVLQMWTLGVVLHLYQAFAARNAIRDHQVTTEGPLAPEPEAGPDPSATAVLAPPEDWATVKAVVVPVTPELDAEGFLQELRSDFERFSSGDLDEDAYEARKKEALEFLKVESEAEQDQVLETVGQLVADGALTAEEGAALEERVHRG